MSDFASKHTAYCAYEGASGQHQGELMQLAWHQLDEILDFGEATHESAICLHLCG